MKKLSLTLNKVESFLSKSATVTTFYASHQHAGSIRRLQNVVLNDEETTRFDSNFKWSESLVIIYFFRNLNGKLVLAIGQLLSISSAQYCS